MPTETFLEIRLAMPSDIFTLSQKKIDSNNGKIILSNQDEILGLVFGVFDIDYSAMAGGSGTSMMSMFGSMNIFNEMIDNHDFVKSQYDLIAGNWINYDKDHSN